MSQRISFMWSMMPVFFWSWTKRSKCDQRWKWNGSPAVGSCWNSSARLLAYPVSAPSQYGDDADSASRCGY